MKKKQRQITNPITTTTTTTTSKSPTTAPIREIFISYQGEGPRVGEPQIFIRLAGCNLKCDYCDTPLSRYKKHGKIMSVSEVLKKITKTTNSKKIPHTISITGGEPLLYPDFIYNLLHILKKHRFQTLLETNATPHPPLLKKIFQLTDFISADIKLPSSLPPNQRKKLLLTQTLFLSKAPSKKLILKIPITNRTTLKEFTRAINLIKKNTTSEAPVFIQPITPLATNKNSPDTPNPQTIFRLNLIAQKILGERRKIHILPQLHKLLWKVR